MENQEKNEQDFQKKKCFCPLCNHCNWHLANKHLFWKDYLISKITHLQFCQKRPVKFKAYTCNYCGNTILLNSKPQKENTKDSSVDKSQLYKTIFPLMTCIGLIGFTGSFVMFKISKKFANHQLNALQNFIKRHSHF